jgi:hypothetical protein
MPRTGPSAADRQLISQLAARDLGVSGAQLERWRQAGLLPRSSRHGCGRGRGSVSEVSPTAVEIAAAVSRHARQGRDLRLAVIDWFAEAGLPVMPDGSAVPEPPHAAVHSALNWIVASSSEYRLLQLARVAHTDQEQDHFYQAADRAMRSLTIAPAFDVTVVREALSSGQDVPSDAFRSGPKLRSAMIELVAAVGMGYEEDTVEFLAENAVESGMFPAASPAAWQQMITRLEDPPPEIAGLVEILITRYDPLQMLSRANAELLRQARTVVRDLAFTGWLSFFHAMLMPDTPGQEELRATATALGIQPIAMGMALTVHTTSGFAHAVVSCLHPFYAAVAKVLSDQAASWPLIANNPEAVEKYMADWMRARDIALQRHRDRAAGG